VRGQFTPQLSKDNPSTTIITRIARPELSRW
jgi:hypothetical protein